MKPVYPRVFIAYFADGTVTRMSTRLPMERAKEQAKEAYRVRAWSNNTWHFERQPMPGRPPEITAWTWGD